MIGGHPLSLLACSARVGIDVDERDASPADSSARRLKWSARPSTAWRCRPGATWSWKAPSTPRPSSRRGRSASTRATPRPARPTRSWTWGPSSAGPIRSCSTSCPAASPTTSTSGASRERRSVGQAPGAVPRPRRHPLPGVGNALPLLPASRSNAAPGGGPPSARRPPRVRPLRQAGRGGRRRHRPPTRDDEVLWAIATRFQADRDLVQIERLPGSLLDPSSVAGLTARAGLDATMGPGFDGQRVTLSRGCRGDCPTVTVLTERSRARCSSQAVETFTHRAEET